MQKCVICGREVDPLEVFPAPEGVEGIRCLDDYANSPEGRRMPTADEIVNMWGGGR